MSYTTYIELHLARNPVGMMHHMSTVIEVNRGFGGPGGGGVFVSETPA